MPRQSTRPATYCETCAEDVAVIDDVCAWCRGPLRRRRGKTIGKHGYLTDDQLRILHAMHVERKTTVRELGRAILATTKYASEGSAVEGIRGGWKRLGFKARDRAESAAIANRHRRAPGSPGTADRAANKRFHRARKGGLRRCAGAKLQYPDKGRPCRHYATPGSEYCWQHDPARRVDVEQNMAAMREQLGRAA